MIYSGLLIYLLVAINQSDVNLKFVPISQWIVDYSIICIRTAIVIEMCESEQRETVGVIHGYGKHPLMIILLILYISATPLRLPDRWKGP